MHWSDFYTLSLQNEEDWYFFPHTAMTGALMRKANAMRETISQQSRGQAAIDKG